MVNGHCIVYAEWLIFTNYRPIHIIITTAPEIRCSLNDKTNDQVKIEYMLTKNRAEYHDIYGFFQLLKIHITIQTHRKSKLF